MPGTKVAITGLLLALSACGSLLNEIDRIKNASQAGTGSSTGGTTAQGSSTKDLTSFYFDSAVTGLNATYSATISGTTIKIKVPYGIGTTLKPSFTTTGASVSVGGVTQTSGVSANSFATAVTYTVTAADGSTQSYNVSVTQIINVQDTGQAACYDISTLQTCASTAAAYPNQDADFSQWPNPRGVQSQSTNASYPSDNFNKDIVSGLVWKTCSEGLSGVACITGTISGITQGAGASACAALNSSNAGAGYGGLKNWRLPTALETMQIQHYVNSGLFFDLSTFPGAGAGALWTSTQKISSSNFVNILGSLSNTLNSSLLNVRCVSGGSEPNPTWTDNGDGTVSDNRTQLTWQRCASNQTYSGGTCIGTVAGINWSNSLILCKNLTLAGRSWRMPNTIEAVTLFDFTAATAPYVSTAHFPNFPPAGTPAPEMWTSTTAANNANYAFVVDYNGMSSGNIDTKGTTATGAALYYARCVSGP